MNALDNSRIGIAAQALGIAQGAYEAALQYAHERGVWQTYCIPSNDYGIPCRYGDSNEAARLLVYRASWVKQQHYEHGGPRHSKEASMAKLYAGDTAMWVSERAIQVLGGYGYTKEFPVERFSEMQKSLKFTKVHKKSNEL